MKSILLVFAILFGSQFVAAKTPAEKQAEAELRHQNKLEKLRKKLEKDRLSRRREVEEKNIEAVIVNEKFYFSQPEWKGRLGLTCPNEDDYNRVIISYHAANQRTQGGLIHVAITYFNNTEEPQDIFEEGKRDFAFVENMCPGGKIVLERHLNWPLNVIDVSWVARSKISGKFYHSLQYRLWRPVFVGGYQNFQTRQTGVWCPGGCKPENQEGTR